MHNPNPLLVGPEPGVDGVIQQSNVDIKPIAFRVAGGILLTSSLFSLGGLFLGSAPNFIALIIDVWLAISLLTLNAGARGFTLFRAYVGAILWPILLFVRNDFTTASIMTVIQLAYCGSLILLLQGKTRDWKIYLSLGIFAVVICAISVLYILAFIGLSSR